MRMDKKPKIGCSVTYGRCSSGIRSHKPVQAARRQTKFQFHDCPVQQLLLMQLRHAVCYSNGLFLARVGRRWLVDQPSVNAAVTTCDIDRCRLQPVNNLQNVLPTSSEDAPTKGKQTTSSRPADTIFIEKGSDIFLICKLNVSLFQLKWLFINNIPNHAWCTRCANCENFKN